MEHFCLFLFTLNASLTCFSQLLLSGCGPWADTELCGRVREPFAVGGDTTPGAPAPTHPQRSNPRHFQLSGAAGGIFLTGHCALCLKQK